MSLLESQLDLLPRSIAREVLGATPRADEVFDRSRDGVRINGLRTGERTVFFHSRYAALREADRLASRVDDAGFALVIGLGRAHHVRSIAGRARRQLVVEPDPALVRTTLQDVDLTDLLGSGDLSIVTGSAIANLEEWIGTAYLPAFHGRLSVVALAGRIQAEPLGMRLAETAVQEALERVKDDVAVQIRFGRHWHRNTLLNLPYVREAALPDFTGATVLVCAAGPSLDDFCRDYTPRSGRRIVAVDSALPVLLDHGIRPDLAVAIDCQVATYHHFLAAAATDLPVVAELSLFASIFRTLPNAVPALGNHPLHRLLAVLGLNLPTIDVRGGNVTQSAVDVAVRAGAREVTLVGADYSYPDGATYARGSYVHRHFEGVASRLGPLESLHFGFLVDRPGVVRDPADTSRWRQPLLDRYAANLAAYAGSTPVRVSRIQGRGAPLELSGSGYGRATPSAAGRSGPSREPIMVLRELETLFAQMVSLDELFTALRRTGEQALAARAMLPFLTALRASTPAASATDLLAVARSRTANLISTAIAIARAIDA